MEVLTSTTDKAAFPMRFCHHKNNRNLCQMSKHLLTWHQGEDTQDLLQITILEECADMQTARDPSPLLLLPPWTKQAWRSPDFPQLEIHQHCPKKSNSDRKRTSLTSKSPVPSQQLKPQHRSPACCHQQPGESLGTLLHTPNHPVITHHCLWRCGPG